MLQKLYQRFSVCWLICLANHVAVLFVFVDLCKAAFYLMKALQVSSIQIYRLWLYYFAIVYIIMIVIFCYCFHDYSPLG